MTTKDKKPEYKRQGIDLHGTKKYLTLDECKYNAGQLADKIKSGDACILGYYNTCLDKDLKKIWNRDQRMRDLVDILSMCAKRKIKGHHMLSSLIKICNYDIEALWKMGLNISYPDIKL